MQRSTRKETERRKPVERIKRQLGLLTLIIKIDEVLKYNLIADYNLQELCSSL